MRTESGTAYSARVFILITKPLGKSLSSGNPDRLALSHPTSVKPRGQGWLDCVWEPVGVRLTEGDEKSPMDDLTTKFSGS
mmetsp:Transcript_14192/g.29047  ORF Transcript_14192/g.29047 Transcript_14192/m.29047 type:complete len:80 (+) Transcript_14192:3062-3301(+)